MERAPALSKASTCADTERSLAIVTPRIRREPTRSIAKSGGTSVRHLPPRGISISLDFVVLSLRLLLAAQCSHSLDQHHSFIHSGYFYSAATTQRRSRHSFIYFGYSYSASLPPTYSNSLIRSLAHDLATRALSADGEHI